MTISYDRFPLAGLLHIGRYCTVIPLSEILYSS